MSSRMSIKPRTGKECKKVDCMRHSNYVKWRCGDPQLNVCMECKWAFVSQYSKSKGVNDGNV